MASVSGPQFSEAVRAAIGSVRHLYREVDRLNAALRDELQTANPPLFRSIGGTPFGKVKNDERQVMRDWYGRLYAVLQEDDVEEPEDDTELEEEPDEGGDEDGGPKRKKKPPAQIFPEQPLLAVKVILYDPDHPDRIEPHVQYVVLGDWTCGGKAKSQVGVPFMVGSKMLRRLLRAVPADGPVPHRVMTNAKIKGKKGTKGKGDLRLSFRCLGRINRKRLYDLDSAEALDRLVADMKAYWTDVVDGGEKRSSRKSQRAAR